MPEVRETESIGELLSDFSEQIKKIIRDEIEMLKLEMSEKAARAGRHLALIAAGGVVLFVGAVAIVWAGAWALATALQTWLAFLIVGVVVGATGIFLVAKNMADLKKEDLKPNRTISSLRQIKEDGTWLKKQM